MVWNTWLTTTGARPRLGSSNISSRGRVMSALAIATIQEVAPSHRWVRACQRGGIRRRVRRSEVQPAVWPPLVVVGHVDPQDSLEVASTQDERPVQAFPPDGPHPALGEGVRPRSLERGENRGDALGGEDRIEALGELGVPTADQEAEWRMLGEVSSLLGHPRRVRMPCHAGHVNAPRPQLDGEQHVEV
jgi:hypothetical protein